MVSYLQQDGEIFLESDFRIDYLSGLKTNKVKDLAFKQPRPILRMRTDRIFMLYKKFSKQVGDTALPTEAGGQKYYKKTSVTKQALCFDYTELMANYNINLNIDMGMPDEEEAGRDNKPPEDKTSPYKF